MRSSLRLNISRSSGEKESKLEVTHAETDRSGVKEDEGD